MTGNTNPMLRLPHAAERTEKSPLRKSPLTERLFVPRHLWCRGARSLSHNPIILSQSFYLTHPSLFDTHHDGLQACRVGRQRGRPSWVPRRASELAADPLCGCSRPRPARVEVHVSNKCNRVHKTAYWLFRVLMVSLAATSLCSLSWAQSATSSLRGTVVDPSGSVVAGASVTITDPGRGFSRSEKTDSNGAYGFLQLPPSTYSVQVTATGFGTLKQEGLVLLVNTPTTLNLTLQIQAQTTSIEVRADVQMLNTEDATLGQAVNVQQIESLPFEGRDPSGILSLQPGVSFLGNSTSIDQDADSRSGAVNGARSDQTNLTIDGVDDNDQVKGYAFQGALRATLDSLEEFRVTTSNANADAGRSSGAQVVMVTKSGTNQFHGTLYEFNRPQFGAANDWFNKQAEERAGLPNYPGKFVRNTFGASVGGPIRRDRLFFFATYEGQRTQENTQVTR